MEKSNLKKMMMSPTAFLNSPWWNSLESGFENVLSIPEIRDAAGDHHLADTPKRIVKMYKDELLAGCYQDPKEVLKRTFKCKSDDMVCIYDISFVSLCAHHFVPFAGKVHFGYIPKNKIVGLSKVPRLVEILSKRPQVQEELTQQIVDTFQSVVKPKGCVCVVEAMHFCMGIRGIKKESAYTRTSAIRGLFRTQPATKYEFLDGIRKENRLWP